MLVEKRELGVLLTEQTGAKVAWQRYVRYVEEIISFGCPGCKSQTRHGTVGASVAWRYLHGVYI